MFKVGNDARVDAFERARQARAEEGVHNYVAVFCERPLYILPDGRFDAFREL